MSAAVRADSVVGWGDNSYGQLGNGGTVSATTPVFTSGLTGVSTIAIDGYSSLAIKSGALYSWGYNGYGELGNGNNTDSHTPIAVSTMASGVTAIAGGAHHSLAIKNGAAYAWGDGNDGQLGNYPGGYTSSNTPLVVYNPMTSGVTALAGGSAHSLGIKGGALYAWGAGDYGQLGIGSAPTVNYPVQPTGMTSGVTAVDGNEISSVAVKNGAVYAWGNNDDGQLGNGTMGSSTYSYSPVAVSNLTSGVTAVAAGAYHNLAIKGGNVYAWGYNNLGQLGTGNQTASDVPVQVDSTDLKNITQVAAGVFCSYALSSDGTIWDWGYNGSGQLGLGTSGTTSKYLTPQHLHAPSGYFFTSIAADETANFALATVATLLSIGDANGDGKVNISDLGILATNYGKTGTGLGGDFNGDGVVNIADLGILATHYGFGTSSSEPPLSEAIQSVGLNAIPEPATLGMAALVLPLAARRLRRHRC